MEAAQAKIQDYITDKERVFIKINGRSFKIDPVVEIAGRKASLDEEIPDDAVVSIKPKDLILSDIFNIISFKPKSFSGKLVIKINGLNAGFTNPVKNNDEIEIYWENIPE